MAILIGKRILGALIVLLALSALIFFAGTLLPGDVAEAQLGQYATPEALQALREELGLDIPVMDRYIQWLTGMLHGDWGLSVATRVPVSDLLNERLGNTALLAAASAAIAVPLAIIIGIVTVLNRGAFSDRLSTVILLMCSSTPEFLIATAAVLMLSVHLGWLPAVSYIDPGTSWPRLVQMLVLPVSVLVLHVTAQMARMTRATLINLMHQPYVEMAALKGLSRARQIIWHALPNGIGPIANVVALNVAYMVSGVVVVETIFAYPGLSRLMIDAVTARDMPVVAACAMIFSAAYVVLMLIADIIALVANPRLRRADPSRT
ncbi:ABC transporter permease [Paracandidimonas soli]|uniref:ABC transporter permease n=1 Tax=Paracandidimonas soli TaxID=1917182 RepID=UPI003341179C